MKTRTTSRRTSGSVMIVALFIMTILAVTIAGYLSYTEQQTKLGSRAQAWNMAMAVSEAGVEEGLQQLNSNWQNLTTDGWTASGTQYSISRTLTNGNSYTVMIDYSNSMAPTIVSRSTVNSITFAQNAPSMMFAAVGTTTTTSSQSTLSRAVRVQTSRGGLFTGAMIARHKIDMNGNNVSTDSFDSSDPAKSTNGRYDPTKVGDRGDVASNDGVVNTVSAGNANIYGHVYTGPGGTATVGSNGSIGEHSWQASNTGIEPGWVYNNANFTFPTITLPYSSGLTPGPQDVLQISGSTTNSTAYNNVTTLPVLTGTQTVGPITTNTLSTTSSTYPGAQSGLSTNTTWNTSATYPGSSTGLTTNYIGFTTTTTYPGNQPMLSTNCATTTTRVKAQPTSGWCGTAPWQGSGNDANWWLYYAIASYTYASSFSYTYPTYTYSYPTYTYSYVVYNSTPLYTTNHYDHVLANGDYYTSDLGGNTLVTGSARLVMPNGLNMNGNDTITIDTSGSLTLYSGGNNMTIGGNGSINTGVINKTGYAANFIAYATSTVTSFTLNGNGTFTGVLVAPSANTRMNGSGSGVDDFTGALLVNSVQMNGHFRFHYDEALARINNSGRFLITSWDEIK